MLQELLQQVQPKINTLILLEQLPDKVFSFTNLEQIFYDLQSGTHQVSPFAETPHTFKLKKCPETFKFYKKCFQSNQRGIKP